MSGLWCGCWGLGLGTVIQNKSDDGDGVSINVVSDDTRILLKADLSQTVQQMTVDGFWRFIRILWFWRFKVGDTSMKCSVGESREDKTQSIGFGYFSWNLLLCKVSFEWSK